MNKAIKIDTSLRERRSIIRLLDYLKRDDLTTDQMERIGKRLQKSGRRALRPLVRKLWQEKNGTAIYRYTCMLDFFENSSWIEQLIQITLKRKDLEEDGRLALLDRLQETGIDVTAPPFDVMTGYGASSIEGFVSECLNDGERGLARYMDLFIDAADDVRERMISSLSDYELPEAVALLEILLGFEQPGVVREAISTLGRIKSGIALAILQKHEKQYDGELLQQIRRSIKRLSFLGIARAEVLPEICASAVPFHHVQAGPVDIYGARSLLFSWPAAKGGYSVLLLLVGDTEGVINALSYRMKDQHEYDAVLREVTAGELLEPVEAEFGLSLLNDAIFHSRKQGYLLPPDLYVDLRLFEPGVIKPAEMIPKFSLSHLDGFVEKIPGYLPDSNELLDNSCFEGWLLSEPAVYDAAERLSELQAKAGLPAIGNEELEPELGRICKDLIIPRRADLVRRLLLAADFMQQTGSDDIPVQQTIAVALSLVGGMLPESSHPFFRRLILDSIETARQALAEGYDLRKEEGYYDEE
jgi:hypothetical protein